MELLALALALGTAIGQPLDPNERPFVFIVEDDSNDEYMTVRALRELAKTTEVARDGSAALVRLKDLCSVGHNPDVILLDLKLPLLNGFEVLKAVKADPTMRDIPVVVFSSSDMERDIKQSTELGAKQFVSKPVDYQKYMESIRKAVHHALLRLS